MRQFYVAHILINCVYSALIAYMADNLLGTLRHRFVMDFIDLGWWPVFKFADVGIVGGLLLAAWR